jgi:hypothetical protein
MSARYVLGLDLGKQADYAAATLLETSSPRLRVRALKRWGLGTPYPAVVDDVKARLASPALTGASVTLAIDGTGVGSAVYDMIRRAPVAARLVSVVITSGRKAQRDRRDQNVWHVPKAHLVEAVRGTLAAGRLEVAATLPGAATLTRELQAFEVHLTKRGNETWGARRGAHDDVLLSLAIALWTAVLDAGCAST